MNDQWEEEGQGMWKEGVGDVGLRFPSGRVRRSDSNRTSAEMPVSCACVMTRWWVGGREQRIEVKVLLEWEMIREMKRITR